MSKTNKIIIIIIILLAAALLIFSYYKSNTKTETSEIPREFVTNINNEFEVLEEEGVNVFYSIEEITLESVLFNFEEGTTVLDALVELSEDQVPIAVEIETYEGMGDLVVAIGDYKNGDDDKYWQYSINDEAPMVSADQYILQDGDSVEWEFKASEF